MSLSKNMSVLVLISLLSFNANAENTEMGEENPLVADTFTKKKHVRYFAEYETVVTNYLEGGDFQLGLAGAVVIQKIGAESTSSSPIAYTIDNSGTKWVAGIAAKYGLTDYFSVGATLTYANGNSSSDTVVSGVSATTNDKESGLQDLTLRAQFALPLKSLGYLAELEWAPVIGTASSNAQTEESNAYPEQSSLTLKNYLIMKAAKLKWGGLLNYDYHFVGSVEQISSTGSTSTREISGGNTLEAGGFLEFERLSHSYLQLSYIKSESSTRVTAAGVSSETPSLDFISVLAAARFEFSRKVAFVPQFQYATLLTKDADPSFSYTQTDIFGISGELRVLF